MQQIFDGTLARSSCLKKYNRVDTFLDILFYVGVPLKRSLDMVRPNNFA